MLSVLQLAPQSAVLGGAEVGPAVAGFDRGVDHPVDGGGGGDT